MSRAAARQKTIMLRSVYTQAIKRLDKSITDKSKESWEIYDHKGTVLEGLKGALTKLRAFNVRLNDVRRLENYTENMNEAELLRRISSYYYATVHLNHEVRPSDLCNAVKYSKMEYKLLNQLKDQHPNQRFHCVALLQACAAEIAQFYLSHAKDTSLFDIKISRLKESIKWFRKLDKLNNPNNPSYTGSRNVKKTCTGFEKLKTLRAEARDLLFKVEQQQKQQQQQQQQQQQALGNPNSSSSSGSSSSSSSSSSSMQQQQQDAVVQVTHAAPTPKTKKDDHHLCYLKISRLRKCRKLSRRRRRHHHRRQLARRNT